MDVSLLLTKTFRRVRQVGLVATLRGGLRHLTRVRRPVDDFDRIHGTDTGTFESLWKLKIHSPNARFGNSYQATDPEELVDSVEFINENPQAFTFIDIGCGKGRTLLGASKLGFKDVIGVEFARELTEIARTNLAKMGIGNVVVEHADAADFHFPNSDVMLYLYNPFSEEVLRRVVENLRESNGKKLYVIYKMPICGNVFDSSGFLTGLGSPPARPNIQIWRKTN
jgi:SAM-dependent methyltransferase